MRHLQCQIDFSTFPGDEQECAHRECFSSVKVLQLATWQPGNPTRSSTRSLGLHFVNYTQEEDNVLSLKGQPMSLITGLHELRQLVKGSALTICLGKLATLLTSLQLAVDSSLAGEDILCLFKGHYLT